MKREEMPEHHQKALALLENAPVLRIINLLSGGPKPFHKLADAVDPYISDRRMYMLVRRLQQAGIVEESVFHKRLVLTEYRLTEKGEAFCPVIQAIHSWAHQWDDNPTPALA